MNESQRPRPDSLSEAEKKEKYNRALAEWFALMSQQYPESSFWVVGSAAANVKGFRLGFAPSNQPYENAKLNQELAAMEKEDDFYLMPPSDIDILVPEEVQAAGVEIAITIFNTYRIFLHILGGELRANKPAIMLDQELLEKGFPFPDST
jgi:hypothetical protein